MPEDFEEQSVVDVLVDAEQIETTEQDETVETTAVDAPKPDNVGEAIKREVERRTAALEKQYQEKYSPITQQNAYLEKMARIEGYSDVPSYLKAIDEYEQRQQIQREAARLGMDPDAYAQHILPVSQKANGLEQTVQTLQQQLTEIQQQKVSEQLWSELAAAYPGLDVFKAFDGGKQPEWYTPKMQELFSRGYHPRDAYELAHKDTLFRQKEQETIARLTGRDAKQVLPSTDSPNNMQFDPDNMSFEDIDALSARARRGERITF